LYGLDELFSIAVFMIFHFNVQQFLAAEAY
jgi:hypothetical protein